MDEETRKAFDEVNKRLCVVENAVQTFVIAEKKPEPVKVEEKKPDDARDEFPAPDGESNNCGFALVCLNCGKFGRIEDIFDPQPDFICACGNRGDIIDGKYIDVRESFPK